MRRPAGILRHGVALVGEGAVGARVGGALGMSGWLTLGVCWVVRVRDFVPPPGGSCETERRALKYLNKKTRREIGLYLYR